MTATSRRSKWAWLARLRVGSPWPSSISGRMLIGTLALTALALVVTLASASVLVRDYLYDRVDGQLMTITRTGRELVLDRLPVGTTPLPCAQDNPGDSVLPSSYALTFLDGNGEVVCRLGDAKGSNLPPIPDAGKLPALAKSGAVVVGRASDESPWRSVVAEAEGTLAQSTSTRYVVVSAATADIEQTIRWLNLVALLCGLVVALAIAGLGRWVVGVGLRPLTDIRKATRAIASGDLTARIPSPLRSSEVNELSGALNTMLNAIEDGFERQRATTSRLRQFAADASHELRTPLTSIIGYSQLYRQVADAPEPVREHERSRVIDRIESESTRMSAIVEDLLLLARLDQEPKVERAEVDVVEIAHDVVADARGAWPQRVIELEICSSANGHPWQDPPVKLLANGDQVQQVLLNLVNNALIHTHASGRVRVRVGGTASFAELVVTDEGPGMPEEVRKQVFERFYRADRGRGRPHPPSGVGGTGLGLAIVWALVSAHGGTIECQSSEAIGSAFTVRFPLTQ
jgi:two-component system, OmpR family, sensor kinase